MATARIPLTDAKLFTNVDESVINAPAADMYDGYVDEAGAFNRRPGMSQFVDLGTDAPVDGIFYWPEVDYVIAVSKGTAYKVEEDGTTTSLGAGLQLNRSVSFVNCNPAGVHTCIMANGGRMFKTTGGTIAEITDADAPGNVTTVAFLDQYILANNVETPYFYWSDVNDPSNWSALSFATAEARPDDVTGVFSSWEEVLVVGAQGIEVWYNDGSTPFVRRQGGYIDRGSIAPGSVKRVDNTWLFIDNKRKLSAINGDSYQILSTPIDKDLQALDTVDDAMADYIEMEGRSFYVVHFPTENKTFCYDPKNQSFTKWGLWNTTSRSYDRFLGNCHAYALRWNKHLYGSRIDGKIYYFSDDYYLDGTDEIRSKLVTAPIDHGTNRLKRSRRLTIRGKRGYNAGGTLDIRVRDDGTGQFGNAYQLSIGAAGDYNFYHTLLNLGIYRSRQYEIVCTDNVPLIAGLAEEEVELLMR